MNYVHLGRSGLKVSTFCLGTMNFGPLTDEAESFAIMDRALELGIIFFDTADVYGWKQGEGLTESILGRWFAQGGNRRERVVLATKVYGNMQQPDHPNPNWDRGLSARKIVQSCEKSLLRMQTDYIDLYQLHHIDRTCPFDEVWQAIETLVAQGKIIYAGSSNYAGWDIATAQQAATHRHFLGLISEQSVYNLNSRMVELEVIPACQHYGLGIIPWSPLAGGLLAGSLKKHLEGRRANPDFEAQVKQKKPQLERYENLAKKLGEDPATLGLAWLLNNPAVTAPIIGPRTVDQLNGSMRAVTLKLDHDTLTELDKIWPGPGGDAPKAYAW